MENVSQEFIKKLRRIILAALLPPLLIAILPVYTEAWPATLLIELQSEWYGGYYYPKTTVLGLFVGIVLVFELAPLIVVLLFYGLISLIEDLVTR